MNFTIRQNATLPRLYMEFSQSGYDNPHWDDLDIEAASITFSMLGQDCRHRIKCSPARLISVGSGDCKRYLVEYTFGSSGTSKKGQYEGYFEITFADSAKLIAPIANKLTIHVI
jgi:hypothetical protein